LLARIPSDARTAAVLSDGRGRRTSLDGTPLLRAAKTACQALMKAGSAQAAADITAANRTLE
jgi:triphosphoribosyl-dephospho-CoA synthetase